MTGKNNTVILNGAKRNEESLEHGRIVIKILRRLPIGTPQNDRESVNVILTRRRRGRISKNMKEKF